MSKFLIMAGGTGGHIFPALAVAQRIQELGHEVIWLGSETAMEERIVPNYHIPLETIKIKGIRGNGLMRKVLLPFTLAKTILAVKKIIKNHQIKGSIGFGGFVSFPGGVASKLSGIPLIIHEQNAIAGLSNRVLAKIATQVYFAFPKVFKNENGLIGNPVRQEITNLPTPENRFRTHQGQLQMLVVGGSLGAKVFNEKIPEMIALLDANHRPKILHQCGKGNAEKVQALYRSLGIEAKVVEFINDMALVYQQADFVVCRAGALTVFELAAAGLGGYLIPFPFAVDDHQTYNANYLVKGGAAISIQQNELSLPNLAEEIAKLSRDQCLNWAKAARKLALTEADQIIAKKIISLSN